jgi:hypothetical protein
MGFLGYIVFWVCYQLNSSLGYIIYMTYCYSWDSFVALRDNTTLLRYTRLHYTIGRPQSLGRLHLVRIASEEMRERKRRFSYIDIYRTRPPSSSREERRKVVCCMDGKKVIECPSTHWWCYCWNRLVVIVWMVFSVWRERERVRLRWWVGSFMFGTHLVWLACVGEDAFRSLLR